MRQNGFVRRCLLLAGLSTALSLGVGTAIAADANGNFTIGSRNVAVADPSVPRPQGKPCVVELFRDVTFTDFNTRPFSYAPPTDCNDERESANGHAAKHWAKVVLEADFSVTAGRQYDRTATLWLGGVNLYFGTTQEPSAAVAPSWHVERDLTDYSALFRSAQHGQAIIGNVVNSTYTGVIHGSARLLFYRDGPKHQQDNRTSAPDAIYPLGADPVGSTTTLNGPGDKLAKTLRLPRNVERAFVDVFAQSQGGDEFWYTCVPDAYAQQVQDCGGGNFREAEVSIDGQAAGVVPVYPWIYTGGIDPYLWRPTPGVQTLNFMPYRVDLTPFVGQLSDGTPHEVAISVAGAHNYFSATAALLVYQDKGKRQVTGKITRNTLAQQSPTPTINSTLTNDGKGNISGDITTGLKRQFTIEGYADTSRGRVTTLVDQTVTFNNRQSFNINALAIVRPSNTTPSTSTIHCMWTTTNKPPRMAAAPRPPKCSWTTTRPLGLANPAAATNGPMSITMS
ncbi:peptide-N4-asparagine amidase [Dyella silvatica]|uniref:peptide-N4-asparagine amidase n=1 Tax=Dyella silvatica TaxID=2992128 RepID=UPI0022556541|nr:peptide-N4-asparagine amidase [Dyella silvatica]